MASRARQRLAFLYQAVIAARNGRAAYDGTANAWGGAVSHTGVSRALAARIPSTLGPRSVNLVPYLADGGRRAVDARLALRGDDAGALLCSVLKSGRVVIRQMSTPSKRL